LIEEVLPISTAHNILGNFLLQGSQDWRGLYSKTSDADDPVPDETFRQELLKTGYLTQAAYAYLGVYVAQKKDMYLPMVSTLLHCAYNDKDFTMTLRLLAPINML